MNNAVVTKVSVNGANEKLNIDSAVQFLLDNPCAELAIPITQELTEDSPLFIWISKLGDKMGDKNLFGRVSYHICGDLAKQIVTTGRLPTIWQRNILRYTPGAPFLQLNIADLKWDINSLDPTPLAELIEALRWSNMMPQVVLQAAECNYGFIENLLKLTKNICIVYNKPNGQNVNAYPNKFPRLSQGYAGDFTSGNIKVELAKISNSLSEFTYVWVDAKSTLIDRIAGTLDLAKAQAFVDAAFEYNKCDQGSYAYAFLNGKNQEEDLTSLVPPAKE